MPNPRAELAVSGVFAVGGLLLGMVLSAMLLTALNPITAGGAARALVPMIVAALGVAVWVLGAALLKAGRGRPVAWLGAVAAVAFPVVAGLVLI